MNSREAKAYYKTIFGGKHVINYRFTQKKYYDSRIQQTVNTPRGLATVLISTDKNGGIIDIEAGLIIGRDCDGNIIADVNKVRGYIYDHYKGQPFDFVDVFYIGELCFPKIENND